MKNLIRILWFINLKTIIFNFYYFPFRIAIKFPVFIHRQVILRTLRGQVQINAGIQTGIIRIGYGFVGIYDRGLTKAIWRNQGLVIFNGSALIKYGAKLNIEPKATLELGNNFRISCNSSLICAEKITIGNDVRISWETTIIDTDFHQIQNATTGERLNPNKPISIGNNVWVGMHVKILRGAEISDQVVIGTNSVVTKPIIGKNKIIAGIPAKIVRNNIIWKE